MIKELFAYTGKYRTAMLKSLFCTLGEVLCELSIPYLMSLVVDRGIPAQDIGYIAAVGGGMAGLALAAILCGLLNMRYAAVVSQGFAANLRGAVYEQVGRFSFGNIDAFSGASLITRMTNDVTQLQTSTLMMLRMLARAPLMLVCALAISMSINFRLSLVVVVAIVLLFSGTFLIMRYARALFRAMQRKLDALNATVQENLIAIRVVKAFVREQYEKEKFRRVNDDMTAAAIRAGRVASLMMPGMTLVLGATMIAVIWFGGRMVGAGGLLTGELMSFISYIMQILMSVMIFSMILMMLTRARASAERILEVLNTEPAIRDSASALQERPRVRDGRVEFRDVSFRYCEFDENGKECALVLEGISFVAKPGDVVGIVGETGSGKTSLVGLIPRFYDICSGAVFVDGIDVRNYAQEDLRDGIGMVMQKNNLFSGTIRENILWGDEGADMERVEAAARDAQAHGFIVAFPQGYETELGQGGVNVSGGQKQRICIARAMIKRPKILILDDSTSAVDTATEAGIRRALRENYVDATVILVAQRIASVREADRILVLGDGRLEASGTHDELMAAGGTYAEIYNSQSEGGLA